MHADAVKSLFHGKMADLLRGRSGVLVDLNRLPICSDGQHSGAAVLRVSSMLTDCDLPGMRELSPNEPSTDTCIALLSDHDCNNLGTGLRWLHIDIDSIEGEIFAALLREVLSGPTRSGEGLVFDACAALQTLYQQAGRADEYDAAMKRLVANDSARSALQ